MTVDGARTNPQMLVPATGRGGGGLHAQCHPDERGIARNHATYHPFIQASCSSMVSDGDRVTNAQASRGHPCTQNRSGTGQFPSDLSKSGYGSRRAVGSSCRFRLSLTQLDRQALFADLLGDGGLDFLSNVLHLLKGVAGDTLSPAHDLLVGLSKQVVFDLCRR
jgi:hypothetical protein